MDNLSKLLVLAGLATPPGPPPQDVPFHVVSGFRVCPETGIVLGSNLHIDECDYTKSPLFIYNRSVRFEELAWRSEVPAHRIAHVLAYFAHIERIWEDNKSKFDRKYFLTQRLLLQEICARIGTTCSIRGRPIRDKRRYRRQIAILEDLMLIFSNDKKVQECLSAFISVPKPSNIISSLQQKSRSQAAR